jgi:uncharacterized membrane protein YphA (DoxX/SURF4 family)
MRLSVAFGIIVPGVSILISPRAQSLGWAAGLLAILIGAAVLLGFLTPFAGASAALGNLAKGISWFLTSGLDAYGRAFTALELVVMSIALVLLGPGAFSLDAYLFGRREIIIPEPTRPRQP